MIPHIPHEELLFLEDPQIDFISQNNVCYEKFVTHLLLYTVANVSRIFRNRRYLGPL